mmetsp:Transcript_18150/g.42199  ORF Transcript_18150/g.42199 Transcript_18150/m.42199 type:complete len:469 (+) Transcript_18150:181-1587(+)
MKLCACEVGEDESYSLGEFKLVLLKHDSAAELLRAQPAQASSGEGAGPEAPKFHVAVENAKISILPIAAPPYSRADVARAGKAQWLESTSEDYSDSSVEERELSRPASPAKEPAEAPVEEPGERRARRVIDACLRNNAWKLLALVQSLGREMMVSLAPGERATAGVVALFEQMEANHSLCPLSAAVSSGMTECAVLLASQIAAAERAGTSVRACGLESGGLAMLKEVALSCEHKRTARALLLAAYRLDADAIPAAEWRPLIVDRCDGSGGSTGWHIADISEGAEDVPVSARNELDDTELPRFVYVREPVICAGAVAGWPWGGGPARLRHKLEVFRTETRGWGVRALQPISKGEQICSYAGQVIDKHVADERMGESGHGNFYIYDVPGRSPFSIDGHSHRGVASFINFSCCPNLRPCAMRTAADGKSLIRFDAACSIAVGEELSFQRDPSAKVLHVECRCDAAGCRRKY